MVEAVRGGGKGARSLEQHNLRLIRLKEKDKEAARRPPRPARTMIEARITRNLEARVGVHGGARFVHGRGVGQCEG